MAFLDPPYGLDIADWDKSAWDFENFNSLLSNISKVNTNPNMMFGSWCSMEQHHHLAKALKANNYNRVNTIVWFKKDKGLKGQRSYSSNYELFVVAWKCRQSDQIFNFKPNSEWKKNVWIFPHLSNRGYICTDDQKPTNKTQKPPEILQRIISGHTNYGGVVLDLCAGSHSLLFACLEKGRSCISIEFDNRQHVASIQRMQETLNVKRIEKLEARALEDAICLEEARQADRIEKKKHPSEKIRERVEEVEPSRTVENKSGKGPADQQPDTETPEINPETVSVPGSEEEATQAERK